MKNSLAIITGASSGIGRSLAFSLAARGYHLVVIARREERLRLLREEVEKKYSIRCFTIVADLAETAGIAAIFQRIEEYASSNQLEICLLANNAGIGEWRPFSLIPLEKQLKNIDLNIKATTSFIYFFLSIVKGKKYPAYILNVASMASFLPVPNYAVYSSTKAYLRFLNESLNYELRGSNVSLTCLCPGGTSTEFMSTASNELTAISQFGMMSSDAVAEFGVKCLLRRKQIAIPGFSNYLIVQLLRILPQRMGQSLMNLFLSLGIKKDW